MLKCNFFAITKSIHNRLADASPLRVCGVMILLVGFMWPASRPLAATDALFPAFHLPYFALTGSLQGPLRLEARLTSSEWAVVESIARRQLEAWRALVVESDALIADPALTLDQKRLAIDHMGYNRRLDLIVYQADLSLRATLSPAAYARLVGWIARRWPLERALHGLSQPGDPRRGEAFEALIARKTLRFSPALLANASPLSSARSYKIFATHYKAKSGAYTVALPDKCLKFANGGLHTCDDLGYTAGGNYSIIISFQGATGAVVGEAGPWNIDDNFWATLNDPTPRRMFADLALGMPEAQAAYYNGYNGGADQYGRKVTGPYAIDLSEGVGNDIGLKWGVNDWVTVSFMWTEGWGAGGSGVQPTWPPGVTPPASSGGVVPVATATFAPDGSQTHRVQPGQSLWAIAIAYGTAIQNLRTLNELGESSVIVPGQDLIVRPPGPTPTLDATQAAALGVTATAATPEPARLTQKAEKRTSTAQALAALLPTSTPEPVTPAAPSSAGSVFRLDPILLAAALLIALGLVFIAASLFSRRREP